MSNGGLTREQFKDRCWTEVRQLVLNDGPVVEQIDKTLEEARLQGLNFTDAERESLIAELIAIHCAKIVGASEGDMEGAPVSLILGCFAGNAFGTEVAEEAGRE